ncbi:TPA: NUDIX domain-containing protein [Candidatus Nomurabacteria bacterium]|nr:MAG: NUDIX hydrolase [Parcubacteria bacterium RAAC4_OD1_1]HCY26355.1 NUDIX domain-containing protein [Candidatus Nomurabacteria bacterium]
MDFRVGVKILLKNKDEKYLILRRSSFKYPEVGPKWDIAGGRINIGESLIDNLKREILEETGLHLEEEPKLIAAQDIFRNEGKHIVRLTYTGNINGDVVLSDEHDEYKWITFSEFEEIEPLDLYVREIINKKLIS